MKRLIVLVASLLVGNSAVAADNQSGRQHRKDTLFGTYGMSLSQSCVFTPFMAPPSQGFDPDTGMLLVDSEAVTASAKGLVTFSKQGVMSISEGVLTETSTNRVSAGDTPVMANNHFTCAGPYSYDGGSITANLSCNVLVPNAPITVTIAPFMLEGYAGWLGSSVNLVSVAGNVQKTQISIQDTVIEERQRICTQNISMERIGW